jgi:hypothetical protein
MPATSRLWDMLIDRSPNMEELSIDGFSVHPVDGRRLVQGRWPHLRKLILGDVILDLHPLNAPANPNLTSLSEQSPSIQFLEAHTKLRSLSTSRHVLTPAHLSSLSTSSLPHLTEFSGTLEQLQSLTSSSPLSTSTLKSIIFREPMVMRDVTPFVISAVLQGLQNLRELKVSFILQSMYESGSLLRCVVACCPRLERLELACGQKPAFRLVSFLWEEIADNLCTIFVARMWWIGIILQSHPTPPQTSFFISNNH